MGYLSNASVDESGYLRNASVDGLDYLRNASVGGLDYLRNASVEGLDYLRGIRGRAGLPEECISVWAELPEEAKLNQGEEVV